MTEEIDPRLIALGLVPAPPEMKEQPTTKPATPPVPPVAPAQAPAAGAPAGGLFVGMGKFTGMPAEAPVPAPPPAPTSANATPAPPAASSYLPPSFAPPSFAPPTSAPPVTARAPDAPIREAPPPLPPLAAARPAAAVAEAPATRVKKDKKPEKAKAEKVRLPKLRPDKVKPVARPVPTLAPSGVLLRGPIVMSYPERKFQLTLEQLGFRIDTKVPTEVAWTDVKEIKARRGRVVIRTKGKPVAFTIPVEGVAEPTLAGPLARVVKEASGGNLDLAGSAFLELQNATDTLRNRFLDEDDPLIPTVVGLVFVLAGLTVAALLPDALAISARTPVAPGAFLLDSPLAMMDPRILVASFSGAAMLAAGVVRLAMGKAATAWARGTLRGWHEGSRRAIGYARRFLAAVVLNPAIAAALLLAAIVLALPSMRVQTVIDAGGFHLMRPLPFFDQDKAWSSVTEMTTVPAPTIQHFEGVAVVFRFADGGTVSTLDERLRGGTDKQLFASATAWRESAR
jgi:hypothetical protein